MIVVTKTISLAINMTLYAIDIAYAKYFFFLSHHVDRFVQAAIECSVCSVFTL